MNSVWQKRSDLYFDFHANLHFQSQITVSPFNHLTKIPFNRSIKTSSALSNGRNTSKHLWELIFYLLTSLGVASKLFKIQHLDIIFNWCCTIITIQHDFRHLQKNPAVLQGRTPMLVVNGVLGYNYVSWEFHCFFFHPYNWSEMGPQLIPSKERIHIPKGKGKPSTQECQRIGDMRR